MENLEQRLTETLLNHLDAITHYWEIIKKQKATIQSQEYELKFYKRENKKANLVVKAGQDEIRKLKMRLEELENRTLKKLN
jgi:hypothetical protein